MATLREKLATSLEKLHKLQSNGRHVFWSKELSRIDRERLLSHGFLREVIKGWVISASPGAAAGDTASWFAAFWEFCGRYCEFRFGEDWHLSPEQSLLLHAEDTVIPKQIIVYSPNGKNNTLSLPFGTSLYDLRSNTAKASDLLVKDGLRLFTPAAALIKSVRGFHATTTVGGSCGACGHPRLVRNPRPLVGRRPHRRRGTPRGGLYAHWSRQCR